ncbi:MAG: hypothetical protein HY057_13935, partial [Rhodospirillales bacterium]|nr:hypothetical protein [Rhodospirillales bacterium]
MLRKLLIGLAAVIVVVAGGLYFVYSNLDSLIKTAVETYGSQATQAEVRLDKVNLSPTTGEGGLVGLRVGNPKGFATPEALRLGEVRMTVDVSTLASSPVIVREIVIVKPQVTYERGPGGSNLEALQKSAAAYAGIGQRGAASGEKQEAGQGPKIIIENL